MSMGRRLPSLVLAAALIAGSLGLVEAAVKAPRPSFRGSTVTFDFENDRYLLPGRRRGALAYVTEGAPEGATLPVVVFLHGLNPQGLAHPWFLSNDADLRGLSDGLVASRAVAPFVLAAPSQSRDATVPWILWPAFDLDGFLDATEKALEGHAHLDRSRVVVVGHSGGGCNPQGGIIAAGSRATTVPTALLAVDTCLDERVAAGLLRVHASTKVFVYWQRRMWPRPFDAFQAKLEGAKGDSIPRERHCEEVRGIKGFVHDTILPAVLSSTLPTLIPPSP